MATVHIRVTSGNEEYEVDLSAPETNGQVWGRDKQHIDDLVDAAVARVKRAYTPPSTGKEPDSHE